MHIDDAFLGQYLEFVDLVFVGCFVRSFHMSYTL